MTDDERNGHASAAEADPLANVVRLPRARSPQLPRRGLLRPGWFADVTMFDPAEFAEQATYDDPHRYPAGAATTVIVNGAVTVERAEHSGARNGRLLRRQAFMG